MNRWIRIVFSGQRRKQSTLAKALPNSSATPATASYTIVDIATSVSTSHPMDEDVLIPQPYDKSLPQRSSSTATKNRSVVALKTDIVTLRASLDQFLMQDYELAPPFRQQGDLSSGKRKPKLPIADWKVVDRIWKEYQSLSRKQRKKLSRQDYTTLMQIVRHHKDSKLASRRILKLHKALVRDGMSLTTMLCELGAQAHLVLGSIPEAIGLFHEVSRLKGEEGLVEQRNALWTMVDGFAANRHEREGIIFLDSLAGLSYSTFQAPMEFQPMYQRLLVPQLRETANLSACSPDYISALKRLATIPLRPRLKDVTRVLYFTEKEPNAAELVQDFSRRMAGFLVKTGSAEMLTPLVQRLLCSYHILEASRVLDMMVAQGMEPELHKIRLYLLRDLESSTMDKEENWGVITQWDSIAVLGIRSHTGAPSEADIYTQQQSDEPLNCSPQYTDLLVRCIKEGDLSGALTTANYMSAHGWSPVEDINFKKLNSVVVNHGHSDRFSDYLQVRYTLGGAFEPDLHTFRRLVYAACRRSDLYAALSLFKLVRTRHPEWTLDTSIYNAIISTAAATGHIRVAERSFRCLLEDGLQPDLFSFHGLLNGYSNVKDLEAAIMIPEQMIKHKLTPTTRTFNLVMKAYLGARRDLSTTRKLFRVMQLSGQGAVPPDLVTFNQLLEGYRLVGNTVWFDAYFDRYFGKQQQQQDPTMSSSPSESFDTGSEPTTGDVGSNVNDTSYSSTDHRYQQKKKSAKHTHVKEARSQSSDDKTLLIQLKHSLRLPNIDLPTIWELWRAIAPKFRPDIAFDVDVAATETVSSGTDFNSDANARSSKTTAATHVPFKKMLGDVWTPATDDEYFRFTTLILFKAAFRSKGDTDGVKLMEGILVDMFPNHPLGQAELKRRSIKRCRIRKNANR
ncbi:hypothetical protein BGX28_009605 [Mortierella sp. GBA30]|nr:hypothetical protein BGX28_009605 [Mortierella sp. GBA30]